MKKNLILFGSTILIIALIVMVIGEIKLSETRKELNAYVKDNIINNSEYAIDYKLVGSYANQLNINFKDTFDNLDKDKQEQSLKTIMGKYRTAYSDILGKYGYYEKALKWAYNPSIIIKTKTNEYKYNWIDYFYINGEKYAYEDKFKQYPSTAPVVSNADYNYNSPKEPSEDNKAYAWTAAIREVKDRLKSPSSAKFPFSYSQQDIKEVSPSTFVVNSYVDAENSFGAKLRVDFMVKIERTGENTYKLLDIQVYE
jgi:hypothetical protein